MKVTILPYLDVKKAEEMTKSAAAPKADGAGEASFGAALSREKKALNAMAVDEAVAKAKKSGETGVDITPEVIEKLGLSNYAISSKKLTADLGENSSSAEDVQTAEDKSSSAAQETGSVSSGKSTIPANEMVTTEITGAKPSASVDASGVYNAGSLVCSEELNRYFKEASDTYGVDVKLLKAIAKAESDYNPNDTSRSGAMGIMQLMPSTAAGLGVTDGYDPYQNIMGGAKYIAQKISLYNGDLELALAAYNAGSGNVKKYGGIPPFPETQRYVKKVMAFYNE